MSIIINYVAPRSRYDAGFSGSVVVPDNVTRLMAWVQGAGGAGAEFYDALTMQTWDYGGGGGGFVYIDRAVLPSEWGTSITVTVGAAVANANGQSSTVSGTLDGASFTLTGGGGGKSLPATGGTASGGDVNIDGGAGIAAIPSDSQQGSAGAPGGQGQDGAEGGVDGTGGLGVAAAFDGYVVLMWG